MALTSINGPATVTNPAGAQAVRNPIYDKNGNIIGSGSTPGANDLNYARNVQGQPPSASTTSPNPPGTPSTPVPGGGTNQGNPLGPDMRRSGRRRNVSQQFSKMNRADPRQGMSLTPEELRSAALSRLKGQ